MRKILKGLYRKEEGQILIFTGIILAVLMGFSAITIDVGMMAIEKSKLQNVADAAALAGAQELPVEGNESKKAKLKNIIEEYATANGFDKSEVTYITPVDGDNKKIKVVATRKVSHTMTRLIDIKETDVSAAAIANNTKKLPSAFTDYGILSLREDAELTVGFSSKSYSSRPIHSNGTLALGKGITAPRFEASSRITNDDKKNEGLRVQYSPIVTIPDTFITELNGIVKTAPKKYTGHKEIDGNKIDLDESIYVDGYIKLDGNNITGKGYICATGDISISGNKTQIGSPGNPVFIYSKDGNIIINGNTNNIYAVIFAPNGKIDADKNNWDLHGSLIAKSFTERCLKNNFNIITNDDSFGGVPIKGGKVKLIG